MNIIKFSAIDSTNSYLKDLARHQSLENYTVVFTEHQTEGRGQRGSEWLSEKGKSLTFSILKKFNSLDATDQCYLSMAVSLAVFELLNGLIINVKIKWPNDILAGHDKIAGILIENSIKNGKILHSVIGIGLNVNQIRFDDSLTKATSLKIITTKEFQIDRLFESLLPLLKKALLRIDKKQFEAVKSDYLKNLYRYKTPTTFCNSEGVSFSGAIVDIDKDGRLLVQLANGTIKSFEMKQIKFSE